MKITIEATEDEVRDLDRRYARNEDDMSREEYIARWMYERFDETDDSLELKLPRKKSIDSLQAKLDKANALLKKYDALIINSGGDGDVEKYLADIEAERRK